MIPDALEKKTKIPVKVVEGRLEYFYGGPLPSLKEGVIGALVVPSFAIEDPYFLQRLNASESLELQPADTILLVAVNPDHVPANLQKHSYRDIRKKPVYPPIHGAFVEVRLLEPLRLLLRGSKMGTLLEAVCHISSLERDASSLNEAYGIISTAFEPHRRSHTGNVFHKVFFRDSDEWKPLDTLRARKEAEYEQEHFCSETGE